MEVSCDGRDNVVHSFILSGVFFEVVLPESRLVGFAVKNLVSWKIFSIDRSPNVWISFWNLFAYGCLQKKNVLNDAREKALLLII